MRPAHGDHRHRRVTQRPRPRVTLRLPLASCLYCFS
jgi:hypothetical protein